MPELTTPQTPPEAPTSAPTAPPPSSPKTSLKRKKKKGFKGLVITLILLALLGGAGYFLVQFLLHKEPTFQQLQTAVAEIGSIESKVSGTGNAKAKETAAITLSASGVVQEVLVKSGDVVQAGQPLYRIYSATAQEEVRVAQERLNGLYKDLEQLQNELKDLTVRAPFSGKLIDVKDFSDQQDISKGTPVATLVNDKQLKLSLYFSYAYEDSIHVGQEVTVSVPTVMQSYTGRVDQINMVSFISPEGAVHFEVVIVFDNPGTLTADMEASASLTAPDGSLIYPYENGKTAYLESRNLVTAAGGPLVSKGPLLNYANVSKGDMLLTLGSDTIDNNIRAKEREIEEAQKKLSESQKALSNFNASAPINGTVTACTIQVGDEVKSGDTVVIISNTSVMQVNITVDDRNIGFITPGLTVNLVDYNDNQFVGKVTSINTSKAESANGITRYPVLLEVDNAEGTLYEGVWLNYSFVTSQSTDCVMIPSQSVIYLSDAEGNPRTVVFVESDTRPENAIELNQIQSEESFGSSNQYPSESDGFYPIPVTTGLSDDLNVEIKSGLSGGETVFQSYTTLYG